MSSPARLVLPLLACSFFSPFLSAQESAPPAPPAPGTIFLDVVVTPKSGAPVSGLEQPDFTVLDNKVPQPLASFKAVRGREAPVEVVIVIDDVNTGVTNVAFQRSQIEKFLNLDGGHLAYPTILIFFTDAGLQVAGDFSTDGKALSAALNKSPVPLHTIRSASGIYGAVERSQLSLKSLYELANHLAVRPGRKFILWVSPGWPVLSDPGVEQQIDTKQRQAIFDNIVKLSAMLREARITIYSIDPLGTDDFSTRAFRWEPFTKGISKPNQADYGDLALQVLATQSGGLVITTSNDVTGSLQKCVADTQAYYELSFLPSLDQKREPYHHLEVHIAKPGLTARTRQGYYSLP